LFLTGTEIGVPRKETYCLHKTEGSLIIFGMDMGRRSASNAPRVVQSETRFKEVLNCKHDIRGSVHHSIIHKENLTRCNIASKFYFIFTWSSTCFGRHTAHHQEPKTAPAAFGFAFVEACWSW